MTNPLKPERILMNWEKALLFVTAPLWLTFLALYWAAYALFGKKQMLAYGYTQRAWEFR